MAEKRINDKPPSMAQLRYMYEQALPGLLEERDKHIALVQGHIDGTTENWFPEWSETDAEWSYDVAIHYRNYFDPNLKQAIRWAVVNGRENPEAKSLLKRMYYAHSRILEILAELKDMVLLSYYIVSWNLCVERLIDFWLDNKGLKEGLINAKSGTAKGSPETAR
jgi:hypothetical protein